MTGCHKWRGWLARGAAVRPGSLALREDSGRPGARAVEESTYARRSRERTEGGGRERALGHGQDPVPDRVDDREENVVNEGSRELGRSSRRCPWRPGVDLWAKAILNAWMAHGPISLARRLTSGGAEII